MPLNNKHVRKLFDDAGYTQRNGLTIALQTCHQEFLEVLINHGRSVEDVGHNELLTASSLESLHFENVGGLFRSVFCALCSVTTRTTTTTTTKAAAATTTTTADQYQSLCPTNRGL